MQLPAPGEASYPVADYLVDRRAPIVFSLGYDQCEIPARFANVKRWERPIDISNVIQAMVQAFSKAS